MGEADSERGPNSDSLALISVRDRPICAREAKILDPDWIRQIYERVRDAREADLSKF